MPKKKQSNAIQAEDGSDIEQFGTIFDHMGVKDPKTTTLEQPKEPQVDVAALLAKIDALSGTVNSLVNRPEPAPQYHYQPPVQPTGPKFEWADPVTEPEAFGNTLAAYTAHVLDEQRKKERAEQDQIQAQRNEAQGLWQDFTSQYKDYADKGDQIGYAYRKVLDDAAARGMDVARYKTVGKQQLFQDVVQEYNKIFGAPGVTKEPTDEETNRTGGIFGGFESGGQPAKGKEPEAGDMIKDLKDIQRASGFF